MFHTVSVIVNILVLPIICIIVSIIYKTKKSIEFNVFEIIGKWFLFWAMGVRILIAGLMQTFNPGYTSNLLGLSLDNSIIIRELGIGHIAIGLICVFSFLKNRFQFYVCICSFIFWFGLAVNHIFYSKDVDNTFVLITDFFISAVALYGIILYSRKTKCNKNNITG